MNFEKLLEGIDCKCGRHHSCAIKHIYIEKGALARIPQLVRGYRHILLAADENTYGVCGDTVKGYLGEKCEDILIYTPDGLLVPNEDAIDLLRKKITDKTDLIVGIGSGVIQDLCKYVSFYAGLPYHIVATAPSMDGYASAGAAMITGNMKVTYNAHVPEAITGDTDILKNAPIDMIKAGYGDIIGKFSCLNDWQLSHEVNGEYLCGHIYDLTYDMLDKTKDIGPALLRRDANAVQILSEALIGVGIAMAYAGNSRPASGSEHHLSHFFEIVGIMKNEPYFMHGLDVAYSSVCTARLREELSAVDAPVSFSVFDRDVWEADIRDVYAGAADGVIALQDKLGMYTRDMSEAYISKWENIKKILKSAPSAAQMEAYLKSAGIDISDFEKLYGRKKIQTAIKYAKDLKDRYTVLWLYNSIF